MPQTPRRNLEPGMRGHEVEALQQALTTLGFAITDGAGVFGETTQAAIRAFQEGQQLPITGVVDAPTAERLKAMLGRDALPEPAPDTYAVRGRVTSPARTGLPDLRVLAVDKNIGEEIELGEAMTDAEGGYQKATNGWDTFHMDVN